MHLMVRVVVAKSTVWEFPWFVGVAVYRSDCEDKEIPIEY